MMMFIQSKAAFLSELVEIVHPKPGRMVVTPSAGLYAEMENGNITPQTKTYILTNPVKNPLSFEFQKMQTGLTYLDLMPA